ncbi:hypothetical protein [Nostoc sp.]|uniref:hypothetical protein n=1 Tax=Nostoc sp. TaxID=1180 RepID=UPI002FF8BCAF
MSKPNFDAMNKAELRAYARFRKNGLTPPSPHKLLTPLFATITKVVHYINARGA